MKRFALAVFTLGLTMLAARAEALDVPGPTVLTDLPGPTVQTDVKVALPPLVTPPIQRQFPPVLLGDPNFACLRADKTACPSQELTNPHFKQIVILSAGFSDTERDQFFASLPVLVEQMTGAGAGTVWSAQKKEQLLFVGVFTGGGALGTPSSSFGAAVTPHPMRGFGLTMKTDAVYAKLDAVKVAHPGLKPFAAAVLTNTFESTTTPTLPPSFADRPFGISMFTRHDLEVGPYVLTHELAHAGLNFVDEYTEQGLENQSIKSFDVLTPLIQLDGTWGGWTDAITNLFGVYSVQFSEILANNGNDNVTTSRFPSTVATPGHTGEDYQYESGFFFGRGAWHMPGANLMNDNYVTRGTDDGFAFAHSPAQQRVIDLAFGNKSKARPNDRLMNAGPVDGWPLQFGSTTHVMLRDADMYHQFQPTQSYTVQVGWYERNWKTCWAAFIPYPCYDDVWTTAQKTVGRAKRTIDLRLSAAYGLASLLQNLLCQEGVQNADSSAGQISLCGQDLGKISQFLPTMKFSIPYRDLDVPASQWMTTYYWRFSTNNGSIQSGFTGWSTFFRSL